MNQFEFDERSVAVAKAATALATAAAIKRRPFAFNEWLRQWPPHTDGLVYLGTAQMIITIWRKQQQLRRELLNEMKIKMGIAMAMDMNVSRKEVQMLFKYSHFIIWW